MKQEEINDKSRRDFLKQAAITTIAATACGSLACSCGGGNKHEHHTASASTGEKVKLLSPDGKMIEVDSSELHQHNHVMHVTREEARTGIPGRKFVMVIDLGRCKNARKCVGACQKMHHLPVEKEWLSVKLMKDNEQSAPYWFPKTCFHCDNPPCVKVCPVNATFKRQDGLVLIDNERCIGCKFCMAACPYSTRVFNWEEPKQDLRDYVSSPETSLPSKIGTVEKCDFCPDMVRKGELPHCVSACPNGTFFFGDINEDSVTNGSETFRFSELVRDKAGYRLMEDLGTKPRVYYLPPVNRNFPFEVGLESEKQNS